MKRILGISLLVFGVLSCSKDTPVNNNSYAEESRFFLKGEVDGQQIDIKAGENDYYLETGYALVDSAIEMGGVFKNDSLSQAGSFELLVRSEKRVNKAGFFDINQNISPGIKALRDATLYRAVPGIFELTCTPDNISAGLDVTWEYADGANGTNYISHKDVDVSSYPILKTKLVTEFSSGCISEVTHFINIQQDCDATFKIQNIIGNSTSLEVISRAGIIESVSWFVDGNFSVSGVETEFSLSNTEPRTVKAEIVFVDGCVKTVERELAGGSLLVCENDFSWTKAQKRVHDAFQLGTVEFVYFDNSGKRYSSYYQDAEGSFEIVSMTPFHHNEKGDRTMRLFFEGDMLLKSWDGAEVEVNDLFGSMAVAHP